MGAVHFYVNYIMVTYFASQRSLSRRYFSRSSVGKSPAKSPSSSTSRSLSYRRSCLKRYSRRMASPFSPQDHRAERARGGWARV